jgi:hypothetical protein
MALAELITKKYPKDTFGHYHTTNKTSASSKGMDVP